MTRQLAAALLLAAPAALAAARGSLPAQDRTVALSVAVETAEGEPLGGLAPGDFEVLLDGKPQTILAVEPGPHPLRLALLVDVTIQPPLSGAQVRRSIEAFARALTPADAAQVWSLGGRLAKESTASGPVMMPSGGFVLPRQAAVPSRATVLELLTANTGGRLFEYEPGRPAAVPDLVTRIVNGLRQEYRIAIARPAGDDPRLIEVRVARRNLTLRSRRIF